MNISVIEEFCWVCGKPKSSNRKLTRHHMIPKHLNPAKNMIVPVCDKCHKLINESDVAGMYAHMISLTKTIDGLNKQMSALQEVMIGHLKGKKKEARK